MTDTAEGRLDAAWAELANQEDYIRSARHLDDEELRATLVEKLRKEKAAVDSWLEAGDCFLISGAGKVHLPNCGSMFAFIDRDRMWAPYLDDLDQVRNWHGDDNAPPMPALLTRIDVEAKKSYTTCPLCAPSLDHTDKRTGAKGWTKLKAGSLNRKHLGTEFTLRDGGTIGTLTSISRVETLMGTDFRANFEGVTTPVTDPTIELMYRTGTRTDVQDSA